MAYGKNGYYVLEWYGGHDPDKGDTIAGSLNSYGFHDVDYPDSEDSGRVYVENFNVDKTSALEQLVEQCQ